MSFVVAVEQDDTQARLLRRLVSGPGIELVVATSVQAAIDIFDDQAPDLLLLSRTIDSRSEPAVDRLRSLATAGNVPILPIPSFQTADEEAFAAEVALGLMSAHQAPVHRVQKAAPIDADVHQAHIALLQADAEARLAEELARVRREADEQRASELARMQAEADEKRRADVAAARAAAAEEARKALTAELAGVRSEAERMLAAELARVRSEAAQKLAVQLAEADAQQSVAVEQARLAAEQSASRAHDAEVARIKGETEARLAAELQRVHEESEQARTTAQRSRQEAEAALADEVARIREEAEARLQVELARARAEAEEARRAQKEVQVDLEAIREAAAREARVAAEQAAARALEAEAERVRAEAESRLQRELARVRAEQEQVNRARQQAQIDADAAREAAVRDARESAARQAMTAADAAAQAQKAELTRLRAEAEMRLRAEEARRNEQLKAARAADLAALEQTRQEVEREARARADAALKEEIVRARADADARLAAEFAEAQAEADRRRDIELAEIREQLAQANAAARENARVAAAGAVSAEVARAEVEMPGVAARAARAGSHAALATFQAAGIAVRGVGQLPRTAVPVVRGFWNWLPAGTIPTIAATLLIAAAIAFVDVSSLTRRSNSLAGSMIERGARSLPGGESREEVQDDAPAAGGSGEDMGKAAMARAPGMLSVFSRVPLDLYVSGTRIGTSEDQQILLPPGIYHVELVNQRLNYRGTVTLNVRPALVTTHTVTLPNGSLQVNTEPGAEIVVEGERMGVSPLGPLPVQIGSREVVVTHPNLGKRREFVNVRFGDVTEVTIFPRESMDPSKAYPLPDLAQPSAPIR